MDDDEFYGRYDVMPPQMDTFGASRRETIVAVVLLSTVFVVLLGCVMGAIWWS